jgi:hypothetical protein
MSETITLQALDLSGETLTLFLRKSDGSLLNASGDAMTEAGTTGVFTATLAESRAGLGPLAVRVCAGSETADNLLYDGFLVESSTVIDAVQAAELDSATSAKLARIEAVVSGTLSGAGTSTEIFVGPSATVTVTADADGNRSAVVVS